MANTKNLPETFSFAIDSPQVYYHSTGLGGHGERIVRFDGCCIGCGVRCYSHDDGEDDPRGILGEHALGCKLDSESHGFRTGEVMKVTLKGADRFVPVCYSCDDNQVKRTNALRKAVEAWRRIATSMLKGEADMRAAGGALAYDDRMNSKELVGPFWIPPALRERMNADRKKAEEEMKKVSKK